jgi:hypothetical protein
LGKVVALGHHLGADQDVGLAGGDGVEQRLPLAARARRVTIDAQHARLRKELGQARLDTLGAAAEGLDVLVTAARAGVRNRTVAAAVMAAQAAIGEVHHQVGRAVRAAADPAAGRARQHRRVAAAVEKDQALLAALQALRDRDMQRRAQAFVELGPRVSMQRTAGSVAATARRLSLCSA